MPRLRLGVALLVPAPHAAEIDGLRRALGDDALDRVPPHLTLVPPVNVRVDTVGRALAVLRDAAAGVSPFEVTIGPPTTFAPVTPTVHLGVVGGPGAAVVHRLRDAVFVPPLERPLTHPFAPHVTLGDDVSPERLEAALVALADFTVTIGIDRVHLLQEQRHGDAHRRWVPVADVPLGPRRIVGRGGVELEIVVSRLLDPEGLAFETGAWPDDEPRGPAGDVPVGCEPVVVTARRRDEVVGVARGGVGPGRVELQSVLVDPSHRRQGVARHLVAAFDHAVAAAEQHYRESSEPRPHPGGPGA